jgi:cytochrome oxidase assembly protein ShyY1
VLRVLARPRWLAFLALLIVVGIAFSQLGQWQLRRHDGRRAANAIIEANADRPPAPVTEVLQPGVAVDPSQQWRPVEARGRWDEEHQLLVRNRPNPEGGGNGYLVLTPLVTDAGPALLVVRGWVPAGQTAAQPASVPAPAPGTVDVIGRVRGTEPPADTETPAGQLIRIDVSAIADTLPYPVYGGFVDLVSEQPPAAEPLPLPAAPEPDAGPHLSYAFQWFLFIGIALVGFYLLLRREQDELDEQSDTAGIPTRPVV